MAGRKIALRIKSGWTKRVWNKGKDTCDRCGSKLWAGPGGIVYCDKEDKSHEGAE